MSKKLTEKQKRLKKRFTEARGYWSEELWGNVLDLDPDFFEAYLNISSIPWEKGSLPPKIKEFIYIAFDAAATHLYQPGLRQHIRNALKYGATAQEIMEVFELTSMLGIHTCTVGVPILVDELDKAKKR